MYMTSTNLKNACGMYKLEQNINRNLELSQVYKSGYAVICLTLISSLVVWYFA